MKFNILNIIKSQSVKYLGLIVDDKLTWQPHIQNLKTKLLKIIKTHKKLKYWQFKSVK